MTIIDYKYLKTVAKIRKIADNINVEKFNDRFERILLERGISKTTVADAVGMSRTGMSSWKVSDTCPRADIAIKIAKMLDVPVDYLVFGEDIGLKQSNDTIPLKIQELSQQQQTVVNALVDLLKAQTLTPEGTKVGTRWQMLPANKQQIILSMMDDMEAAKKEKK